jgi:hypothetical protein
LDLARNRRLNFKRGLGTIPPYLLVHLSPQANLPSAITAQNKASARPLFMNVGLEIIKCTLDDLQGAKWEQIHLISINDSQFNLVKNRTTICTVFPYRVMYNRDHTQIWGTCRRSILADDFEESKQINSEFGEIEIAFKQNCFLKEGEVIYNADIFNQILND